MLEFDKLKDIFVEDEVLEWYALSPAERFAESEKLWEVFVLFGGNYDPEPDTQSPFNAFLISECRTPELLASLADHYPDIASQMAASRPLLKSALDGDKEKVNRLLSEEEDNERKLDRQYWDPLKAELEIWRHKKDRK